MGKLKMSPGYAGIKRKIRIFRISLINNPGRKFYVVGLKFFILLNGEQRRRPCVRLFSGMANARDTMNKKCLVLSPGKTVLAKSITQQEKGESEMAEGRKYPGNCRGLILRGRHFFTIRFYHSALHFSRF